MIRIGRTCKLAVLKAVDFGFYLDAKNLGEVLLPLKYAPPGLADGDSIEVFLYLDAKDRLIATTQKTKASVEEFAHLKVLACTQAGAFLDWGLEKDLFVASSEQHIPMKIGQSYLVYIYLDKIDGRIAASSKIDKFLEDEGSHDLQAQQAVDLIIANSTELGYKAIINHRYWGLLYKNDVFQRLSFGQNKKGFIKCIRADGKIDLTLQGGQESRDKFAKIILSHLIKQKGFAPVHDKSDPQLIAETFGMSKSVFKKTIGGLYKKKVISIEKDGIHLIEKQGTGTE